MKNKEKLYVVRQYVRATSAEDAIRKSRKTPVDDVWVDDKWKEGNAKSLAEAIGFTVSEREDD